MPGFAVRYELSSLDDIYKYTEVLLTAVARLEKSKATSEQFYKDLKAWSETTPAQ